MRRAGVALWLAGLVCAMSVNARAQDAAEDRAPLEAEGSAAGAAEAPIGAAAPAVEAAAPHVSPDLSEGWPSSELPPGPSVRPRRVHREDVGRLVVGALLLGIGYGGAVAWSAYYFDAIPIGNLSCNDAYAGLMLVPVVPVFATVAAADCVSVQLDELLIPTLSTAVQIVGLALLLAGLAGGDAVDYDGPELTVSVGDAQVRAFVTGRF